MDDDLKFYDTTGQTEGYRVGQGVRPDEVIHQKQSDLLRGRDTLVLRALEWLQTQQGGP